MKGFDRQVMPHQDRWPWLWLAPVLIILGAFYVVPVADVLRFEGGRIVEHWGVMDTGQMMEQLL